MWRSRSGDSWLHCFQILSDRLCWLWRFDMFQIQTELFLLNRAPPQSLFPFISMSSLSEPRLKKIFAVSFSFRIVRLKFCRFFPIYYLLNGFPFSSSCCIATYIVCCIHWHLNKGRRLVTRTGTLIPEGENYTKKADLSSAPSLFDLVCRYCM